MFGAHLEAWAKIEVLAGSGRHRFLSQAFHVGNRMLGQLGEASSCGDVSPTHFKSFNFRTLHLSILSKTNICVEFRRETMEAFSRFHHPMCPLPFLDICEMPLTS